MRNLILITCVLILFGCKREEKTPNLYGGLKGVVTDSYGTPIENASVKLNSENAKIVKTDAAGVYSMDNIAVGAYSVMVSHDDFITATKQVNITKDVVGTLDYALKTGTAKLSVANTDFSVSEKSGSVNIDVKSNASWTVTSTAAWLNLSTTNGDGNKLLSVTFDANTGYDPRFATIEIDAGTEKRTIKLRQDVPLKILSKTENPSLTDDSLTVVFNKKITVKSILYNNITLPATGFHYRDNQKVLRFKIGGAAKLGSSFAYTLNLTDSANNVFSFPMDVKYYTLRKTFTGGVFDYLISPDNTTCWAIIGGNPYSKLAVVSLENLGTVREIDLPFHASAITLNPYNNCLYISSDDKAALYVISLTNYAIVKTIVLSPVPGDNSVYPMLQPGKLEFLKDGFGALGVGAKGSSGADWKIVDSSNGDAMSYHSIKTFISGFARPYVNYDFSKIFLRNYMTDELYIYDQQTHGLNKMLPPVPGRLGNIVTSRTNSKVFFIQRNEQYIYDFKTSQITNQTYVDLGGWAEFSYKKGEEDFVYFFDAADIFYVFDYKNAKTVVSAPSFHNMYSQPKATTNGKYLLLPFEFELYIFSTDMIGASAPATKTNSAQKSMLKSYFRRN